MSEDFTASSPEVDTPRTEASTTADDRDKAKKIPIDILNGHHRETLSRAVSNVLSTKAAETAYAQVIDGLPLREAAMSLYPGLTTEHPIFSDRHRNLCPGVLEKLHEFRDAFNPGILELNSRVLLEYQAAGPRSRAFNTRLIELVALAVHQIAVLLFQLDTSLHKDDGIVDWTPSKEKWSYWEDDYPNGPLPTLLYHPWYRDYEQYPEGVADMVGFWAEGQVLGGVVLFDRRPEAEGAEPDAVYWHPSQWGVTYRICKLLPEQKQSLVEFLGDTTSTLPGQETSILPLHPGQENLHRVDPEEPIVETGIYRDPWERKEPPPPHEGDRRLRDVWDTLDFPTRQDKLDAGSRARDRMTKHEYVHETELTDDMF